MWHEFSSSIYKKEQFLHRFNVKEKIYKPLKKYIAHLLQCKYIDMPCIPYIFSILAH